MTVTWPDRLLESPPTQRKRPVIGREPSGPFSIADDDRRILATGSDGCTHRLRSRDSIRELVGHHLEQHPPITRDRGPRVVRPQLHSGFGGFGATPSLFQNGLLRKPLGSPPFRYDPRRGSSGLSPVVSLLDRSPQPIQQRGNQQTARSDQPARATTPLQRFSIRSRSGMIEDMYRTVRCEHGEAL